MRNGKPMDPTRRRALRIVAAMAGVPLMIAAVRASAPKGELHSWQGEVLGAVSELTLWHTDAAFAQRAIRKVRQEIERYERIFSLYRVDSEIARLNAAGRLARPSFELRTLVEESQRIGALSAAMRWLSSMSVRSSRDGPASLPAALSRTISLSGR